MNPDHFDNQEAVGEWGWERCIQEPTGDSSSLDAAKATPTAQLDNMTARTSTTSVPKTEDRRDKKKSNSKAYRDRCRENKKRQEDELKMQAVENARLKDENESLVKEKDTILRPKLELAANVGPARDRKTLENPREGKPKPINSSKSLLKSSKRKRLVFMVILEWFLLAILSTFQWQSLSSDVA
ncbi:hypothetical protein D5086_001186 [Populus alba]|uniref:Uncharacterized protein n=1 Tax=Populus alba TaxID=43335 RepID=A0ACC4CY38_POPAL